MTTPAIAAQAAMNLHRKTPAEVDRVAECVSKANNRLSQSSTNTTSSYKRRSQNHVGPWRLGRTLGKGASGRVRLAKHTQTGQLSAVKIVPKSVITNGKGSKNTERDANGLAYGIEREIIIMKLISHPHVMGLYDVWENKGELYLVLEYIEGGELFDYLIRRGRLDEKEAVKYFKQIISGMNYCHHFNICHRDLKPENLLLDKNHNIKIADFGMAALETKGKLLETSCGSPHYASPEIVAGKHYHGGPSDIWSCGVILFALLTGHLPFDDPVIRNLLLKVQSGKFRMPQYLSVEAKDLIWQMLKVNPNERIKMKDILSHPLLKKYSTKEDQLLEKFNHPESLDASPIVDIDKDILLNLQTLWRGTNQQEIRNKLSEQGLNSQKIFYRLLQKYRDEHANGTELSSFSSKRRIPRSTSIVTTIVQDENGEVKSKKVEQVAEKKPLKKRPKNTTNIQALPSNKSVKGIAASTSKKPVSFKSKSGSVHSLASKKSLTSMRGKPPMRDLPKLPELSDFQYLCDEIFGQQTRFSIYQDEEPLKLKTPSPQKPHLQKDKAATGLNSYISTSLDPKSASKPSVNSNASDVLRKFGVRMSKLDMDPPTLPDSQRNENHNNESRDTLKDLPASSTLKKGMTVSKSTSSRKLSSLINKRDLSVEDYNRHKAEQSFATTEYDSFTFLSAKQIPIITPDDRPRVIDDRFADVDEDEAVVRDVQSTRSTIRHHRKVESTSTRASTMVIPSIPQLRSSVVVEELPETKRSRAVRESVRSDYRLSKFSYLGSYIGEVETESRDSMFADPDEDYDDEDVNRLKFLQIAQKTSGESAGESTDESHEDMDDDDESEEEPEGPGEPEEVKSDLKRNSTMIKNRIMSLVPRREAPIPERVDTSPMDPNIRRNSSFEAKPKSVSWFSKIFSHRTSKATTQEQQKTKKEVKLESNSDSAALTQLIVQELRRKESEGLVRKLEVNEQKGTFSGMIPSRIYGRSLKFHLEIVDEVSRSRLIVRKIKGPDKAFRTLVGRVRVIC